MDKTVFIGKNNGFSNRTNRWLSIFFALLFFTNGILMLSNTTIIEPFKYILGFLNIAIGCYQLFYGVTAFSKKSKFAPRVYLNDKIIEFKNSIFKQATQLSWNDIRFIKFGSYEITFQLASDTKTFSYKSNAEVSIKIKKSIREFAESRCIKVI